MNNLPPLWVYKCNSKKAPQDPRWGDWAAFFDRPTGASRWGGTDTIFNVQSRSIIRNRLQRGDLILCWQTNRHQAEGLCVVDELPVIGTSDDGQREVELRLAPIVQFAEPVPLLTLKQTNSELSHVRAFQSGVPRSLYETTPSEARTLLRACGLDDQSLAESRRAAANAAAGGGFGDAESNAEMDKATQAFVEATYRSQGWRVTPVNLQRGLGYDIKAKKGKMIRHIEVKGVGGSESSFFITRKEVEASEDDPHWCLAVVTNTLSASKTIREWTAAEFLQRFDLMVVNYRASLLPER